MQRLIRSLRQAIPDGLEDITALAKPLTSRSQDVLAYFDYPSSSNGPTPSHQRTPQIPPDNNHLNQAISPTYHTLKCEEPVASNETKLATLSTSNRQRRSLKHKFKQKTAIQNCRHTIMIASNNCT